MKKLKYLTVLLTPAVVGYSLYADGYATFTALFVLFGVLPTVELFTQGSTVNLSAAEEELAKNDRFYDWLLYALVPLQYGLLLYFLRDIASNQLTTLEAVGKTIAMGLSCGVLGINAAHELGHRPKKSEQQMSKLLLLSSLYLHFFIEHNRGHHKRVATPEDPASARYGETVYAFWVRSIVGSWLSAWQLEAERLAYKKLPAWHWKNELLQMALRQLAFVSAIALLFGLHALVHFMIAAAIGVLLLESVNYLEHYGLQRQRKGDGYERTLPIHSWNSNHPMGRLVLLELSRHSDHHYSASRKYPILRHFDESPQLPTGYPGMILLALVPPLWFAVMHWRIDYYRSSKEGASLV